MNKSKKKISDVRLYKTVFEVRYQPKISFYNALFSVAEEIKQYPHWETDRLSVIFKNFEKFCSLAIRNRNIAYDQDFDDSETEEKNIRQAVGWLPEHLNIPAFTRIGLRKKFLIVTDMRFEELKDIMALKLLSQEDGFGRFLPPKIDDLSLSIDSSEPETGLKFHILLGPVRKSEIPKGIAFNKQHHLNPQTAERDFLQIFDKYPEVAVFVDIDIYRDKGKISPTAGFDLYLEARKKVEEMVARFEDYLFKTE